MTIIPQWPGTLKDEDVLRFQKLFYKKYQRSITKEEAHETLLFLIELLFALGQMNRSLKDLDSDEN